MMTEHETVLRAENLHKSYIGGGGTVAILKGLEVQLQAGELVALFGPSGSGKTTLLNLLAGLDRPDSGEVYIEQQSIYAVDTDQRAKLRAQKMGFVFQMSNLIGSMTAFDNVKLAVKIANSGVSNAEIDAMLQTVGLAERRNNRPNQLSGGEQQRVAVARAIINHPRILFADEPTGNLDATSGLAVMELLHRLVEQENLACLLVSHNQEWRQYADRVLQLRDGLLEEEQP